MRIQGLHARGSDRRFFRQQKIERWGFDPELLYLARRAGLKVQEVPVAWAHVEGTRLSPLRDGIRMFGEVLKIRWYAHHWEVFKIRRPD